jgi:hypothetical protein
MKYFIFVALCIAMGLLTACSRANVEVQPTTDHVLTILARRTYEGPIRQAEQALLAEWAQRPDKQGHTLTLELTTFHPDDEINHLTRLDTMLMAGQAYDIFFPVADHRHIREYALSGFVTDFYPLIENCQHSSLDDFFTNALQAWEIDGGLYVFPWDFEFNFAFMNSGLPQPLIDRFNEHDTIMVTDLVDMYRELLRYYSHDFGNFAFSHGSTLHHPSRIIVSSLGDFVDFENHTAHLTNDAFIAFLTDFSATFDERHFAEQNQPYWENWWTHCNTMTSYTPQFNFRTLAMIAWGPDSLSLDVGGNSGWWDGLYAVTMPPHAFIVESREQFPVAAITYENVYAPFFERGIPLADENGHLLIANDSAYPSGVAISAAANGAVAWDFTRHLVNAFNRREVHSFYSLFYSYSTAMPIVRELFEFRMHASLAAAQHRFNSHWMTEVPLTVNIFEWVDELATLALPHVAALAEMPMALTRPPIPEHLYIDNLELLLRGLITPHDFAQRAQNAVSLWLIGG